VTLGAEIDPFAIGAYQWRIFVEQGVYGFAKIYRITPGAIFQQITSEYIHSAQGRFSVTGIVYGFLIGTETGVGLIISRVDRFSQRFGRVPPVVLINRHV